MADRWGIEAEFLDATGHRRTADPATIDRLREIIGTPDAVRAPVVVTGGAPTTLGPGELVLEDGSARAVDGTTPVTLPSGYHRLEPAGREEPVPVIVAPSRCHLPERWRAWGWASQLYATRSTRSWGLGDLADLRRLAGWATGQGAGFVLINPIGAVLPSEPQQPSPYFPASRSFRNPIYLSVEDVPGVAGTATEVVERAAAAGRALNESRTIDRDAVWRLKSEALEAIWSARSGDDGFDSWYGEQPAVLTRFATWAAVAERHGPRWREWPDELAHPDRPGVTAATRELADRVRYHAWLQWLVEQQLAAVGRDVAVIQDLPIGVDPDGFDAWVWQDLLAPGVSVGAPPDEFNSLGQDWGLPPFVPWKLRQAGYDPFIATIRATMAAGGGLRIDHVMGLFRLWWIVDGSGPESGAYVRYPAEDLLAIVALESQRAEAVVVGEDLGTVEEGARDALAEHDVLSYRLLWFEDDEPARWPRRAMAAVTTHDLPTVAGLWDGSDLEAQERAGLEPNEEGTATMRGRLAGPAGLDADAPVEEAVVAAHTLLAEAPSVLLAATLDDAVVETERPNVPGADGERDNWSIALAHPLELIEEHPVAARIAAVLDAAVHPGDSPRGVS